MTFLLMLLSPVAARWPKERLPPRLASSPSHAAVVLSAARFTRTSPPPIRVIGARTPGCRAGLIMMFVSAVFIRTDLISDGVRVGYFWSRSADEPAIMGVAPEVPPKADWSVPEPATAETEAPGAPMSGLIAL